MVHAISFSMIEAKKQTSPSKSSDDYLCYEWDHNQVTSYEFPQTVVLNIKLCSKTLICSQ